MDTLAARIKSARQRLGITQQQLAQRTGMRQGEISKLEGGFVNGSSKLVQLAHALECDPLWLATGKGAPHGQPGNKAFELDGRGGNVTGIEVRGASDFLGGGIDIDKRDASTDGLILGSGVFNGYAIKVRGDHNAPALKDGQFVVLEEGPVIPGDMALFHLTDGRVLFRELLRETDDAYHVDSATWGSRQTIPKDDVEQTEAVVAVVPASRWVSLK